MYKGLPFIVFGLFCLTYPTEASELTLGASGTAAFATKFYQAVAQTTTEDFIVCPFCLSSTLAMLSIGAVGHTQEGLRSSVGMSANTSVLDTFKASLQSYKYLRSIRLFNGLLLGRSVQVNPAFDSSLFKYFGDHPHYIPPGVTRDIAVQMIVEDKLNLPGSDEETGPTEDASASGNEGSITLINYLNFYGGWEKRFDVPSTTLEPFILSSKDVVMAKMMRQTGHFHVAHLPQLKTKAVSLPYLLCAGNVFANMQTKNNSRKLRAKKKKVTCKSGVRDSRFHLVVLMPYDNDNGLRNLEANLTGELFQTVLRKFQYKTYLDLSFPSFTLKSRRDLVKSIENLIPVGEGDYSGLSRSVPLSLDSVFHNVAVTVEERGSRTKSSLLKGPNIQPRMLKINRPFIGFIHDKKHDQVLTVFRITKPRAPT